MDDFVKLSQEIDKLNFRFWENLYLVRIGVHAPRSKVHELTAEGLSLSELRELVIRAEADRITHRKIYDANQNKA